MQVGRMFRAEAAITIKQNKTKTEIGRHPYIEKGDRALSINGAKTATHEHSFSVCYLRDFFSFFNQCLKKKLEIPVMNEECQLMMINK